MFLQFWLFPSKAAHQFSQRALIYCGRDIQCQLMLIYAFHSLLPHLASKPSHFAVHLLAALWADGQFFFALSHVQRPLKIPSPEASLLYTSIQRLLV